MLDPAAAGRPRPLPLDRRAPEDACLLVTRVPVPGLEPSDPRMPRCARTLSTSELGWPCLTLLRPPVGFVLRLPGMELSVS